MLLACRCTPPRAPAKRTRLEGGRRDRGDHAEQRCGWPLCARNKPLSKVHDLYAKALALEYAQGTRLVIVTADLIGFPREFRDRLEKQVGERYKLAPASLLLNPSHTHSGPELRAWRASQGWDLPAEQIELGKKYAETLLGKTVELVGRALNDLKPAQLSYMHARAGFAMNRRSATGGGYSIAPNSDGPVDHDVPVLQVSDADGKVRALLFGYACHNTRQRLRVLRGLRGLCPGVCGTDAPRDHCDVCDRLRRRPESDAATHHGVGPTARTGAGQRGGGGFGLPLASCTRAAASRPRGSHAGAGPARDGGGQQQAASNDKYAKRHAEMVLAQIEKNGRVDTTYPYLVQVARFGDDLTMIALAGEVVVDYSLRLKAELAGAPVWVMGYTNDVFGYVPSERVLQEGGYEAKGAILYYGTMPTPFLPSVEELIVGKVHELVNRVKSK